MDSDAMSGFPVAWEETQSVDILSDKPPYSLTEIADYLFWNHYNWVLKEKPTTFDVTGPHAEMQVEDRRYWLFEARDQVMRRQWFIVVGTGKSPFDPSEMMKRWMYAETNDDDLSPDEFLEKEYREQIIADVRSRRG
jgi:hypothetical protein